MTTRPAPPPPMRADEPATKGFSLKRWSKKKLEAARAGPEPAVAPAAMSPPSADAPARESPASAVAAASPGQAAAAPASDAPALPPVESLTFDSDFAAFLQPKVDETLKRQALKQLFRDPRFNVMDGLDVYIDDYSKPDPISPELVRQLVQARYIFDPPATRVNERGEVEDVPPEETAAARGGSEPAPSTEAEAAPPPATEAAPPPATEAAPAPSASAAADAVAERSGAPVAAALLQRPEQQDALPSTQAEPSDAALPAERERGDPTDSALP